MGLLQAFGSDNPELIVKFLDLTAHFNELRADGLQVLGNYIFDHDIAPGNRRGKHKGSRLDLVRDDGIGRPVQLFYALDPDDIGSGALDIGAHAV